MRETHFEEEDYGDVDMVSSQKEKGMGQKGNPRRSKHSETEQRRRLKINERFQVLMDLIPQNDQKRDKASFLLEVIQYIKFLQAKLDMYENWSPEPSKLVPRRNSSGQVESFIDQPQLMRNGSALEDKYIVSPSILINSQNSVNSNMAEAVTYTALDHSNVSANQEIIRTVAQSRVLGNVQNQPFQSSHPDPVFRGSHPQSQFCQSRTFTTESDLLSYVPNEEELRIGCGKDSSSNAYSHGLLNNLTQALRSSGVDLTQASISVQLDVGKRGDTGLPSTMFSVKDYQNQNCEDQTRIACVGSSCEPSNRAEKRPRI